MNFLLLLLSLLLCHTAIHAEDDCVNCSGELKPFNGLVKNVEALQSPTVINCADQLKEDARAEYQAIFAKLPKQKTIIKGLNLEGSADELKFLGKMLKDKPTNMWAKAKDCKTVVCALTKVYSSEESAHRALNLAKRDGYIISASKDFTLDTGPTGQLFSLIELQKIDLAFKMLPVRYKKLKTLDRIKRLPDGYSSPLAPNAAAYASPGFHSEYINIDGEITFLDSGFSGEDSWGPLVAVHELSHHVDYSKSDKIDLGISETSPFLEMSGWKKTTTYETDEKTGKKKAVTEWKHAPNKKFVTDYAGTQPAEDFAEAAAHYVYFPKKFKNVDPEKYNFIKNTIFGGKEFLNEPDIGLPESDILKTCIEGHKDFSLYGNQNYSNTSLRSDCLKNFIENFKHTNPTTCSFNNDQLKNYLYDKIAPLIEETNASIKQCDRKLEAYSNECLSEGDFQKKCSIEKCDLTAILKTKVKDSNFRDRNTPMMNAIMTKMGKEKMIAISLINGLSEKNKVAEDYPLTIQKYFVDNASNGLNAAIEKENFKFDSPEERLQKSREFLRMDKNTGAALSSFQSTVLKKATRSKEKNLDLIKAWAASESLKDDPLYIDLAETLIKYGGGFFNRK